MSLILVTNPCHDQPTSHLSYWVKKILDSASSQNGHTAIKIEGQDVSRDNVKNSLEEHSPDLVLLNGHGTSETVYGFNNEAVLDAGDSEMVSCLEGKVVHTLACEAGQVLGPDLISSGVSAFVGYKEKFKFNHKSSGNLTENDHDDVADLFLEPAYSVTMDLCSGKSVKDAYEKSQSMLANNLIQLLAVNTPDGNSIAANLYHNLENHVLLGNQATKI